MTPWEVKALIDRELFAGNFGNIIYSISNDFPKVKSNCGLPRKPRNVNTGAGVYVSQRCDVA